EGRGGENVLDHSQSGRSHEGRQRFNEVSQPMFKFSLFKELADFFSFKARRLILLALVVASVAGTFYWHWPAIARLLFTFGYVALIVLAIESQAGYFVDFTTAAV